MVQFLNSEQAKAEQTELEKVTAELEKANQHIHALEALIKAYSARLIETEMKLILLETEHGNNNG